MADYRQHQKLVKVHTMHPSLKQEFDDQSSAHFRGSGLIVTKGARLFLV